GAYWTRGSKAAAVPGHALFFDYSTCCTPDILPILEARARRFRPLLACIPPFSLLRRDNSGSPLSPARGDRALSRYGPWSGTLRAPDRNWQRQHPVSLAAGQLRGVTRHRSNAERLPPEDVEGHRSH